MNISIIVAISEDNGIGKNNELLWHIPSDLKRFKEITRNHTVIMGKNTFLSLPNRPLKNRKNIVITDNQRESFEGCITVFSIVQAMEHCEKDSENFVIGGASVYRQFLPYANRLYLSRIHCVSDADTFFPEINDEQWAEKHRERIEPENGNDFAYDFIILQRKN